MALINCPECNKEISDKAKVCPNCGLKIKKKSNKVLIRVLMVLIVLVIIVCGALYFVNKINQEKKINQYKKQASVVSEQISKVLDGSVAEANDIIQIKKEYDELDTNVKEYVSNKDDFENFEIPINEKNFSDYFDILIEFSSVKSTLKGKVYLNEYDNIADEIITIQPKADFTCNSVVINLDLDMVGWENGNIENARLEKDGSYSKVKEINYETIGVKAWDPVYYEDKLKYGDITGTISFN